MLRVFCTVTGHIRVAAISEVAVALGVFSRHAHGVRNHRSAHVTVALPVQASSAGATTINLKRSYEHARSKVTP